MRTVLDEIAFVDSNIELVGVKCVLAQGGACRPYRELLLPLRRIRTGLEAIGAALATRREEISQEAAAGAASPTQTVNPAQSQTQIIATSPVKPPS